MDSLPHLLSGFAAALSPAYLAYAFVGCVFGTLIGVLPGLGPSAGTAILIPLTFKLDPTGAIIMLAAIYYGAMYGGTITSVLINVPGEAASVITCLDGHQMAKQGRGGTALGIAAIGSFIGGVVATLALAFIAPPLAKLALKFGPPEFFALMLLGLCLVSGLAGHVDQDRRDRAAVHRAVVDRREHDDRAGRVQLEGERDEDRRAGGRSQARQDADQRAEDAARERVGKVRRAERGGESRGEVRERVHRRPVTPRTGRPAAAP